MKKQSVEEFKEDLKKQAGGEIKSSEHVGNGDDFDIEAYDGGQFDHEVEPYENPDNTPPEYNEEFRAVNLGPAKVRELLKTETDPEEIKALELAQQFWAMKSPGGVEMGEPYRGEEREAIRVEKMSDLPKGKKVTHISVNNELEGAEPTGGDVFDFDGLVDLQKKPQVL